MPTPAGTGFFVSPDGWFITAAHVVTENGSPHGPVRTDLDQTWLMKEARPATGWGGAMCQAVSLQTILPHLDVALLKVDFAANSNKDWLRGRSDFPFLLVSSRQLDGGEPVYSFGYPLPSVVAHDLGAVTFGDVSLSPRVTSAIISSTIEKTTMVTTAADPKVYVLDKALNYGNSGGPIVSAETGRVHALCSRFQPLVVVQPHLRDGAGKEMRIVMPSLYGVVSSLGNSQVLELLRRENVPFADD